MAAGARSASTCEYVRYYEREKKRLYVRKREGDGK